MFLDYISSWEKIINLKSIVITLLVFTSIHVKMRVVNKITSFLHQTYDEYKWHFLLISVIVLVIFFPYISGTKDFFIGSDQKFTYNPYTNEWLRLIRDFIKTGEFPFYSWYKFLGSDFYSSANIYVTGDVFMPLLLLFKDINYAMLIETILLIYISSFTFHKYLKEFGIKDSIVRMVISVVYSFSGIALLYYSNYMFHRFYAFLPLLFLGVDYAIKKHKYFIFLISVVLLFFSSIYFMFPTSLFLAFYTLMSLKINDRKILDLDSIKIILKLMIVYIVGFSLTAFLNVPSIYTLLNNNRVGDNWDNTIWWPMKVIIGLFFSHISAPFTLFNNFSNMFVYGEDGHATFYSVYLFSASLPVLFTFFLKLKAKNKLYLILLYFFIFTVILFKPFNSIMHGFSIPSLRFIFLYIFVLLIIIAYTLDEYKGSFIQGLIIFIPLLFIILYLSYKIQIWDYSIYNYQINLIYVSIFIAIIASIVKNRKALYFIIILELIFSSFLVIYNNNSMFYEYEPSINKEYVEYYQSIDEDVFYRMYVNPKHLLPTNTMNLNHSFDLGYFSVMSYDSAYETNLVDFFKLIDVEWNRFNISDPEVLKMLGVKYFIVYDETELPTNFNFTYMYDLNFLKVYRLENYRSLGYTYSNFELLNNAELGWSDWNTTALINENDWQLISDINNSSNSESITILNRTNNSLEFEITLGEKQLLFLSIPYNNGWNIYEDNSKMDYIKVNGGFIGIILGEGYHNIHMQFIPVGFKIGTYITIGAIFALIVFAIYCYFKNKNLT